MLDRSKQWLHAELLQQGSSLHRTLALSLFYLLAVLVLYAHIVLWPAKLVEGQLLPYNLRAPEATSYEDQALLDELTGVAQEGETLTYTDPAKADEALTSFDAFASELQLLRTKSLSSLNGAGDASASEGQVTDTVSILQATGKLAEDFELDPVFIEHLVYSDETDFDQTLSTARLLLSEQMKQGVTDTLIRTLKRGGISNLITQPQEVYAFFLKPNLVEVESQDRREELRHLAWKEIARGELIVGEGERVSARAMAQIERLEPQLSQLRILRFLAAAIVLLIAMALWYLYAVRFNSRKLGSVPTLLQLALIYLIFLVIGLGIGRLAFDYIYYGVSFAVAALAVVIVLIYDERFAVFLAFALAVVLSISLSLGASLTFYTVAAAFLPSVLIAPGGPRKQQVFLILAQGGYNVLIVGVIVMATGNQFSYVPFTVAFVAGFAAAVVALGLLPVVETVSGQLTPSRLFELANPENELLKRLKHEAHGTYSHSEMVADLTEDACKAIDANWLTARVGALYHDIGKLKRPGFFAENIHDLTKNPHQGIPPETSVKILKDHVTDGLAMARELRLPRELHQFIAEHHGTYLIKYFFYQAVKQHEADPDTYPKPDPKAFQYGGPIPSSRESGVVMLADITEAVARARRDATSEELVETINQIVEEKFKDGQLTNSGLTVGDLTVIKSSFSSLLAARRHQRIQYPDGKPPAPVQFHFIEREQLEGQSSS